MTISRRKLLNFALPATLLSLFTSFKVQSKTLGSSDTGNASGGTSSNVADSLSQKNQPSANEKSSLKSILSGEQVSEGDYLITVKQPFPFAARRTQHDKNADILSAMDVSGMKGDGITDDSLAFEALETAVKDRIVELGFRKYKVKSLPVGNIYFNGMFVTPSIENGKSLVLSMGSNGAILSSTKDTGEYEARYHNPLTGDYQQSGRSTRDLHAILASQNSRSGGPARAVNIASIYSYASGNVSGNYSARQSRATVPQSVNLATEDCRADQGFRNVNIASITSHATGETSLNIGSRRGWSTGYHTVNLASVDANAGGGRGAILKVNVNKNGTIDSVSIINGGIGYSQDGLLRFYDRLTSPTVNAEGTYATDSKGTITDITVTKVGKGYSTTSDPLFEVVQASIMDSGNYSANIATANGCSTYGEISFNLGASGCIARGNRSGNIASTRSKTVGTHSVIIGSELSSAKGDKSLVLASGGSNATAELSVVIGGTFSNATGLGSIVMGRRTINDEPRSIAFGDATTGEASGANRKWHLHANGNMEIAGTLVQNQSFTDIAKMFENIEKQEIPVGALVAWEGRRVRLAHAGDCAFSVHSRTYATLLGDSQFTWSDRWLRDEFGQILNQQIPDPDWQQTIPDPAWPKEIPNPSHPEYDLVPLYDGNGMPLQQYMRVISSEPFIPNNTPAPHIPNPLKRELVTVPIENPAYDPRKKQIPRSERASEWTPVALVGEVHTRVDDTVNVDDYVEPSGVPGLGTKSKKSSRLRCMELRQPYDKSKGYAVALCLKS